MFINLSLSAIPALSYISSAKLDLYLISAKLFKHKKEYLTVFGSFKQLLFFTTN